MYPFDPDVLFEDLTHPTEHQVEHRSHSWFKGVRALDADLPPLDGVPRGLGVPSQRLPGTPQPEE